MLGILSNLFGRGISFLAYIFSDNKRRAAGARLNQDLPD